MNLVEFGLGGVVWWGWWVWATGSGGGFGGGVVFVGWATGQAPKTDPNRLDLTCESCEEKLRYYAQSQQAVGQKSCTVNIRLNPTTSIGSRVKWVVNSPTNRNGTIGVARPPGKVSAPPEKSPKTRLLFAPLLRVSNF